MYFSLILVLCIISLIGSGAYLTWFQTRSVGPMRTWSKTAAVGAMACVAALSGASILLVISLAVAAIGDWAKSFRTERGLHFSICASLGVNLFLALSFYRNYWVGIDAPTIAFLGIMGVTCGYLILIWPHLGRLKVLALVYAVSLQLLILSALGVGLTSPMLVLGTLVYSVSLILVGLELFFFYGNAQFMRIAGPVIWSMYYIGLWLITGSVL